MPNMSLNKVPMPEQDPNVRNRNFEEVALGYTEEMAREEAERCLNCKHRPCVNGCPVNVQIPEFITLIKEGKFEEAYDKILETNSLPAVCGRVCPQETQCEERCVRQLRESRLQSVVWNGLLPTGAIKTHRRLMKKFRVTVKRSQLSDRALPLSLRRRFS